MEKEFIEQQKIICNKYHTDFLVSTFDKLIGVSLKSFNKASGPINGLRHPIENVRSASWYIWTGEYSNADDFFEPIHIEHLLEVCPSVIKYLGLPPGWRFLVDNSYEDVWYDENLLNLSDHNS